MDLLQDYQAQRQELQELQTHRLIVQAEMEVQGPQGPQGPLAALAPLAPLTPLAAQVLRQVAAQV